VSVNRCMHDGEKLFRGNKFVEINTAVKIITIRSSFIFSPVFAGCLAYHARYFAVFYKVLCFPTNSTYFSFWLSLLLAILHQVFHSYHKTQALQSFCRAIKILSFLIAQKELFCPELKWQWHQSAKQVFLVNLYRRNDRLIENPD